MYNESESTSKRISFQSIFSSLCNLYQGGKQDFSQLEDMAYAINERLHIKYPCEPEQKTLLEDKPKPSKCPKCGRFSVYHNKGISKKSGAPYENYKCSNKVCGYINWISLDYDGNKERARAIKSMRQDEDLDVIAQENYERQQEINSQYAE